MSLALPKPPRRGRKPPKPIRRRASEPERLRRGRLLAKGLLKLCDELHSLHIRLRDRNRCRLCGSTSNVQCAHLISRRYKACRWSEENCWALCHGCHMRYTHDPLGWDDLCEKAAGVVEWARRKAAAQVSTKPDYSTLVLALALRLGELRKRSGNDYELGKRLDTAMAKVDRQIGGAHGLVRQA